MISHATGRARQQVAGALAGGVQLGHGLVEVHPDPAHQPSSAHELTSASRGGDSETTVPLRDASNVA